MLERFVRIVDGLNEGVGRCFAWFTLGCVLVTFGVVILRYLFSTGFIWMTDLYVWLHALVFMVGAGYTFKYGGHVRVDIFYSGLPARKRAWIDIFGTLVFLMPWLIVIAAYSSKPIIDAWEILEPSANQGGMQGLFIMKTSLWVFCALVGLQGLALIARSILVLRGREDFSPVTTH
ncbi:MAG: TRAP transporter small permease subunit [Rhodospirillales bacterium]